MSKLTCGFSQGQSNSRPHCHDHLKVLQGDCRYTLTAMRTLNRGVCTETGTVADVLFADWYDPLRPWQFFLRNLSSPEKIMVATAARRREQVTKFEAKCENSLNMKKTIPNSGGKSHFDTTYKWCEIYGASAQAAREEHLKHRWPLLFGAFVCSKQDQRIHIIKEKKMINA